MRDCVGIRLKLTLRADWWGVELFLANQSATGWRINRAGPFLFGSGIQHKLRGERGGDRAGVERRVGRNKTRNRPPVPNLRGRALPCTL
jgi:hypothetical protein